MTLKCEIISKGRCQAVTGSEIEELRVANVSWFAYCQKRLTKNHSDALSALNKQTQKDQSRRASVAQ